MTRLTPAGLVFGLAAGLFWPAGMRGVRSAVNLLGTARATAAAVDNTPESGGKLAVTP
jgi:hypothetical protein